jgi:hypothetical protein
MNHWQLYVLGMILTACVSATFLLQEIIDIYAFEPTNRILCPSVMCFAAMFLIWLIPANVLERPARFAVLRSFGHCLISPFAKVTFRDFFFADVLCSATVLFSDFTSISCLITAQDFKTVRYGFCPTFRSVGYCLVMLPFWIRLMQCLRRFHDDRTNWTQFYNAGKYSVSLITMSINATYKITKIKRFFWIYLGTKIIATFYSYGWDIYMDWGLLRASNGLRP